MTATISLPQVVDRWVAMWNEDDPVARRKIIDDLWTEDGSYVNRLFVCSGPDMVEAAVTTAHDEYFAKGLSFRSCNDSYGHHGGVKFGWVLVTASGEVDTFGHEFLILDDRGRISVDYQFGLRLPPL